MSSTKHSQIVNRISRAIAQQSSLRDVVQAQPYLNLWEAAIRAGVSDYLLGECDGYPYGTLHQHTAIIDVDGDWAEKFLLRVATLYWDKSDFLDAIGANPINHSTRSGDGGPRKCKRPVRSSSVVPWPGVLRSTVGV